MGPNARVWRAFLDECEVFDVDMVTEARDGLDLHLVFVCTFVCTVSLFLRSSLGWSFLRRPRNTRHPNFPDPFP